MVLLQIAPLSTLLTHFRFFVNVRSQEGTYHSLILFRLSTGKEADYVQVSEDNVREKETEPCHATNAAESQQIYIMESSCPHLGADMSHAEIEECDTTVIAVCPWHRYDFDLNTGKSETGLQTCTYPAVIMTNEDGIELVNMESPKDGTQWRLIELRPVSEEFADPPPPIAPALLPQTASVQSAEAEPEPVVPLSDPPKTLMQWAVLILKTSNPTLKVERTRHAVQLFRTGKLSSIGHKSSTAPLPPDIPPREASFARNTVDPTKVKNRRNRAAMLHALANIEQWAIDLAWDIMARFGPSHPDIPPAFFSDFTKMALDESKHFTLLTSRLAALSPSTPYGSMPVHAGLWESATVTAHSLQARLAIIHLVHEARGLDVNPATIDKFQRAGDEETVKVMEIIHADEVTHVTSGHRWFTWICAQTGLDPVATFRKEVRNGWRGDVKGPFNVEAREQAGLTPQFYEDLKGEMGLSGESEKRETTQLMVDGLTRQVAAVSVGYDVAD